MFLKIDLMSGYHQVHIKEEDIYKTSFWTKYGNHEFVVVPFALTNALATFMWLMNSVFRPYMDKIFIAFIDDILIYSKNEETHDEHLAAILRLSIEHQLYVNFSKEFSFRQRYITWDMLFPGKV